eukprot:3572007-Pyramimonas_sp.AAC.1
MHTSRYPPNKQKITTSIPADFIPVDELVHVGHQRPRMTGESQHCDVMPVQVEDPVEQGPPRALEQVVAGGVVHIRRLRLHPTALLRTVARQDVLATERLKHHRRLEVGCHETLRLEPRSK